MGYSSHDGRGLVDLISEMESELRGQLATSAPVPAPIDWTSTRDSHVQAALLRRIDELGGAGVTRSDLQAEVAHLPLLAGRVPRFFEWASNQGLLRVDGHGDQGKEYGLTDSGRARAAAGAALPAGSTRLD